VVVSRGLAAIAGLPHLHLAPFGEVSFDRVKGALRFADGEYDLVEYAWVLHVHRTLAKQFDISLNGSFGEVARGYWWELLFPRLGARRKLDARKLANRRFAAHPFDPSLFPADMRLDLGSHFTGVIERVNQGLSELPNSLQMDHAYLAMRMQRWQGRIASSTNQVWPCLSPFLFRSILETILQTETRLRRGSLLVRKMLAEFQPQLASFPLEHGFPALPVTWKTFHRFLPAARFYADKVTRRLGLRSPKSSQRANGEPSILPPHLQLWRDEEVRSLLHLRNMKLGSLLDWAAAENFLKHSQSSTFPFGAQWTRLLSLEYALRVSESIGRTAPAEQALFVNGKSEENWCMRGS